jgi:chromosome segregation ATPase
VDDDHEPRLADDDSSAVGSMLPARRAVAKSTSEMSWWEWTDKRIDKRLRALDDAIGEFTAQYVGEKVNPLKCEIEFLRRELAVLRQEVAVERGLKDLREEVKTARAEVPKVPAIAAQLEAEQARLAGELRKVTARLGRLRVEQGIDAYNIEQLEKRVRASAEASVEMEFESRSTHFQMRAAHPEAARALKEFAAELIDRQADGTLWLPGSAGTA